MTNAKIGLMLVAVLLSATAAQAEQAKIGQQAPDFSLQDQNGQTVNLKSHEGKIVVLEWINPDCPYVQRHYREQTMKNLASKWKDQGVVWLAVNTTMDATNESNKRWIDEHGLGYSILNDASGTVGRQYGAKTTPHMFVIDKQGHIVYNGAIDNDPDGGKSEGKINYVDRALGELAKGTSVSTPESKPYGCSVKYAKQK